MEQYGIVWSSTGTVTIAVADFALPVLAPGRDLLNHEFSLMELCQCCPQLKQLVDAGGVAWYDMM